TPSGLRDIGRGAGGWVQCGEVRDPPSPGDHCAHEHGDADRDSDEVSDSKERERETEVETGRGAIVAQAEVTRHVAGENTGLDDDVKHGRYGGADCVTRARRKGMVYITPRMPPVAQTVNDIQKGKPVHQPTITRPGRTK